MFHQLRNSLLAMVLANLAMVTTGAQVKAPPNPPLTQTYSLADVLNHHTPADCWTIYSGKVYDLSKYIPTHPGGSVINPFCGTDMTAAYNAVGHAPYADTLMANYLIGYLAANQPPPPPPAPITVTINSPYVLTVAAGSTVMFTATVTNADNIGVTWMHTATTGSITGSGATATYVAPSAPTTDTVTAISQADPTVSKSIAITVIPTPPPPPPPVDTPSCSAAASGTGSGYVITCTPSTYKPPAGKYQCTIGDAGAGFKITCSSN